MIGVDLREYSRLYAGLRGYMPAALGYTDLPHLKSRVSRKDATRGSQLAALEATLEAASACSGAALLQSSAGACGAGDKDMIRFAGRLKLVKADRSQYKDFALTIKPYECLDFEKVIHFRAKLSI
jgi:hypothetical protein